MYKPLTTHPPTERELIALCLRTKKALTWKGVGERLGVSRERARQIYLKAERKLRHPHRWKNEQT